MVMFTSQILIMIDAKYKFDEFPSSIEVYGSSGENIKEFKNPSDVADTNGNLFVTDLNNQRIQIFV